MDEGGKLQALKSNQQCVTAAMILLDRAFARRVGWLSQKLSAFGASPSIRGQCAETQDGVASRRVRDAGRRETGFRESEYNALECRAGG